MNVEQGEPGFWGNQEKAQEKIGELKSLTAIVAPLDEAYRRRPTFWRWLIEMADEDESLADEVPGEDGGTRRAARATQACALYYQARTTLRGQL